MSKTRQLKFYDRFLAALFVAISLWLIGSAALMIRFARIESKKPETIGITFSQVQAERFGSNWRANYLAMLDDLKPSHIRLIAYWDRIEIEPNEFDFAETDWMLDEATKRDTKVTLALGQRVPRYPECFYPSWLDKDNESEVAKRAKIYIGQSIEHYKNHQIITGWQLENEFLLHAFGQCPSGNLTRDRLREEIEVVRRIDATRPIIISASDEFGLPFAGPRGDIYGFSMYKRVWNQVTKRGYFTYLQPGAYNWWRAATISYFAGSEIRVHELQAEPWGPVGNEKLDLVEAAKSMNPAQLRYNIEYARSTHIRHMDLWGVEWWYWLKTHKNDPAMWDAVRLYTRD